MAVFGSFRQTLETLLESPSAMPSLSFVTQELLIETILGIMGYREEGAGNAPGVFLLERIDDIGRRLGGLDLIPIGEGPPEAFTIRKALKSCGPLARQRDWAISLQFAPERVLFGVFRCDPHPLAEPSFHRLRSLRGRGRTLIGIQRNGESVIEVRFAGGPVFFFDSSGKKERRCFPSSMSQAFARVVTSEVRPPQRNKLRLFYEKILEDLFTGTHGSLAAILESGKTLPPFLKDGIHLQHPLDPITLFPITQRNHLSAGPHALQAYTHLIRNMLEMDGVTLFDTRGRILGYHAFVLDSGILPPRDSLNGGARSRAFHGMKAVLGPSLRAVLYKSQDGDGEFEDYREDQVKPS
jgi:hypothetical protein